MSTCIYKYPLQEFSIGGQFVSMPQGARLLTAQLQDDVLVIWAVVVQENIQVHRKIVLVGTGWVTIGAHGNYLGTVQYRSGLVFHVFDHGEEK